MAFTREEVAAHEQQTPTVVPDTMDTAFPQPAASAPETTQPAASTPAPAEASPAAVATDPDAPGGESSADTSVAAATTSAEASAGETQTQDGGEHAPPAKGTAADRIQGLVGENKALREYIEYREQLWKGNAPAAPQSAPATQPSAPAAPTASAPAADPRPTLEQFDYDLTAHAQAEEAWLTRQVDRQVQARLSQTQTQEQQQTAATRAQEVKTQFEGKLNAFAKDHSDFAVVAANPVITAIVKDFNPATQQQLVLSEQAAPLLYHLGQHVDVATRIARMTPAQQLVALGKLEGELSARGVPAAAAPSTPSSKQKTLSQAPPPPSITPAGGVRERSPADPSLTMDEFVAQERKRDLQRREAIAARRKAMR